MTQQLTALLNRYADDASADHAPPPAPSVAPSRQRPQSRLRPLAVPALAAASVVAVVAGASLVDRAAAPPAVVTVADSGTLQRPGPDDTPPPPSVLHPERNQPSPPAPPGRERLTIAVELPDEAVVERLVPYTVAITNPTDAAVSLRPCPSYLFETGGMTGGWRLPCGDMPESIQPGQTLRLHLTHQFGAWDGPDMRDVDVDFAWGIAGPPAARARITLKPLPLGEPIATAPFLDEPAPPGEPMDAIHGMQAGQKPAWNLVPTIIAAPETVVAGSTLRYTVRLVNVAPKDEVSLRPCRGLTQWLQRPVRPAGEQVAFLDWSFERHEITSLQAQENLLNCAALPSAIPPRKWVQLEMELQIPADYAPGPASLAWKVGELDVFGSMQTRYATVDVVAPR